VVTKLRCVNCGTIEEDEGSEILTAFYSVPYRDVCPTDRGDEVREGSDWYCEQCYLDMNLDIT